MADVGAFSTATARYVFAVATVHGIDIRDVDRRRELLLAAVAGNGGVGVVERLAGRTGGHWGRRLTKAIPIDMIDKVNGVLAPRIVTKNGTKQGILVLGRIIPFGLGAGIGAVGNVVVARMTVAATRSAFGPLPKPDPRQTPSLSRPNRRPASSPPVERGPDGQAHCAQLDCVEAGEDERPLGVPDLAAARSRSADRSRRPEAVSPRQNWAGGRLYSRQNPRHDSDVVPRLTVDPHVSMPQQRDRRGRGASRAARTLGA